MNLYDRIKQLLHDPLATFKWFERVIALVCVAIPALLRWADTDAAAGTVGGAGAASAPGVLGAVGFRASISDYVGMADSYIYGMLMCMAAMLFIFNGAVYFRNEVTLQLRLEGKWYNVILGLSLIAIILFPNNRYESLHYFFAGIFFLGNALVIVLFHDPKDRVVSIVLAVLVVAALALHYILHAVSLLVGEWISLAVIAAHFLMQANRAWPLLEGERRPGRSQDGTLVR